MVSCKSYAEMEVSISTALESGVVLISALQLTHAEETKLTNSYELTD